MLGDHTEHVAQPGVYVDGGRECSRCVRVDAGPGDHERNVTHLRVNRDRRLAPRAALAEVDAMVSAQDDSGRVPRVVAIDGVEDPAEPMVDHRQLRSVLGTEVPALTLVEDIDALAVAVETRG